MFLLGEDVERLGRFINERRLSGEDIPLVLIDPITAFMGKLNSNLTGDVRSQL
jgi:hypothetical protein